MKLSRDNAARNFYRAAVLIKTEEKNVNATDLDAVAFVSLTKFSAVLLSRH